jgi:hypothetical protein
MYGRAIAVHRRRPGLSLKNVDKPPGMLAQVAVGVGIGCRLPEQDGRQQGGTLAATFHVLRQMSQRARQEARQRLCMVRIWNAHEYLPDGRLMRQWADIEVAWLACNMAVK